MESFGEDGNSSRRPEERHVERVVKGSYGQFLVPVVLFNDADCTYNYTQCHQQSAMQTPWVIYNSEELCAPISE